MKRAIILIACVTALAGCKSITPDECKALTADAVALATTITDIAAKVDVADKVNQYAGFVLIGKEIGCAIPELIK